MYPAPPILIIAYRRAETTKKVLEAIQNSKTRRLYVALNAPSPDRLDEKIKCEAVRKLFEEMHWKCKITFLNHDKHLSAKESITKAITWFFEFENSGIILEDDCVPSASFFSFAGEMLFKYEGDKRIGMISGNNFQFNHLRGEASYYFSRYCNIWGWATWRDRWTSYDSSMRLWPSCKSSVINELDGYLEKLYWAKIFERTYDGFIDTWDYQWLFANWVNHRISLVPQVNMVTNIGFGRDAHHTNNLTCAANMIACDIALPICHTNSFIPNRQADKYTFKKIYLPTIKSLIRILVKILRKYFKKIGEYLKQKTT